MQQNTVLHKCSLMPNFTLLLTSHFLLYTTVRDNDNESGGSESSSGSTTVIVVGVVCSLTIGVLLEAVGV